MTSQPTTRWVIALLDMAKWGEPKPIYMDSVFVSEWNPQDWKQVKKFAELVGDEATTARIGRYFNMASSMNLRKQFQSATMKLACVSTDDDVTTENVREWWDSMPDEVQIMTYKRVRK